MTVEFNLVKTTYSQVPYWLHNSKSQIVLDAQMEMPAQGQHRLTLFPFQENNLKQRSLDLTVAHGITNDRIVLTNTPINPENLDPNTIYDPLLIIENYHIVTFNPKNTFNLNGQEIEYLRDHLSHSLKQYKLGVQEERFTRGLDRARKQLHISYPHIFDDETSSEEN